MAVMKFFPSVVEVVLDGSGGEDLSGEVALVGISMTGSALVDRSAGVSRVTLVPGAYETVDAFLAVCCVNSLESKTIR
jgi:hypothetical protein